MARVEFSRKTRAAAYLRCKGLCESCGARLKPGEGEFDHILPCALGGEPSLENCSVKCRVCHTAKTASDVRRIRKADRQRDKATGAIRPKHSIKSAPFPQSKQREPKQIPPRRALYQEATSHE